MLKVVWVDDEEEFCAEYCADAGRAWDLAEEMSDLYGSASIYCYGSWVAGFEDGCCSDYSRGSFIRAYEGED